jgi:hypothetical protein
MLPESLFMRRPQKNLEETLISGSELNSRISPGFHTVDSDHGAARPMALSSQAGEPSVLEPHVVRFSGARVRESQGSSPTILGVV